MQVYRKGQSPQCSNKAVQDNLKKPEKCFHHVKNYPSSSWNLLRPATKNPQHQSNQPHIFSSYYKGSWFWFIPGPFPGWPTATSWAVRQVAGDGSSPPATFFRFYLHLISRLLWVHNARKGRRYQTGPGAHKQTFQTRIPTTDTSLFYTNEESKAIPHPWNFSISHLWYFFLKWPFKTNRNNRKEEVLGQLQKKGHK